ncbi:MAG: GxxExxY protein [Candidatus Cloacimonetes bacterium]|nr:GxxExxY protein [Candidatus Cloacimonadota bacterium]MCF7813830.1 GxxExxY protein [Candidatus Cloacimonadota bacterium]MCF7868268.1 GxxExxY protein [Candidatus Cloacimonadota bacterium]MCF7883758.1 GxxExxY protein [Candidatus Cloacimonadota bacterium]
MLKQAGLSCDIIQCFYEIDNRIISEIKAVKAITEEHEAQLLNYLRSTNIEVGLILNFGEEPEFSRKVYDNERKK